MSLKRSWTVQSLLSCWLLNAILLSLLFLMAKQILTALRQWVGPFAAGAAGNLPPEASSAFAGLHRLLGDTEGYIAPVVFGMGTLTTLTLWMLERSAHARG